MLERAAHAVAALPPGRRIVAIDGRDGAGKTTFADALAPLLDRPAVRASADDFLNPPAVRYRLGRESPEGFFRDSVDVAALRARLLEPFARGEPFRRLFHAADAPLAAAAEVAPADAVLVLDGLFLHRPELRGAWDVSIFLDVPLDVAADRLLRREGVPTRRRYVEGMELYLAACDPRAHATLVLPWD
jgi:uridine kinase